MCRRGGVRVCPSTSISACSAARPEKRLKVKSGSVVQASLLAEATAFRDANIMDVSSYEELRDAIAAGKWARGWWAGVTLP